MKRKLLVAIICCLPTVLFAQWSVVPSGSAGMSDFRLGYKGVSDFKPDVGFSGDVSIRYHIPSSYFYASAGVGYLSYRSINDAEPPIATAPHSNPEFPYAYFDERMSAVYFPVMVGFYFPDKKLSPIIEAGGALNVVLDTGSFTEKSGYEKKSTMFSFTAGAGARYKLYKNNALEVKLRYSLSTDMLDKLSDSNWSYFSLNVGYVINL